MSEGAVVARLARRGRAIAGRRQIRRAMVVVMGVAIAVGACAGSTVTPGAASSLPAFASIEPGAKLAMGNAPLLAPASDGDAAVAAEINDFGLDMFRRLDPQGNFVFSPTSIALALAMARLGANGDTAAEMDRVLHSLGAPAQGSELVALLRSLDSSEACGVAQLPATPEPGGPSCELSVSDAAFVQTGWQLEPAYLDALSSRFGAGVNLLDFAGDSEAARLAINAWVNQKTRGRITDPLQPGSPDSTTRLCLANAIYLKASWEEQFWPESTALHAFTKADGTVVDVPTMAAWRTRYASDVGWRAIDLPYQGNLSMMVVVPDDMTAFVASLDAQKLAGVVGGEQSFPVVLTLPRFSTRAEIDLAGTLSAMGMPSAFDLNRADLSGIDGLHDLSVGQVVHAANIDVDEKGTTAAAVTLTLIVGGALPTPPPITFNVDRPFLYFIRDTRSGAILFMGRIDDPSAG